MISVPLYLTAKQSCSYLEDKESQSIVVDEQFGMTRQIYSHLIERGFRRSGNSVYAPHCQNCSACIACRIKPTKFVPNRSQKRCIEGNKGTVAIIKPCQYDNKHEKLYTAYITDRHTDSLASATEHEHMEFFGSRWCETWLVEFHVDKQLAAVAVVDVLSNALSAVYTFYNPQFKKYGLGTYAVLWQIEKAKQMGMENVYLGYWVENSQKMGYKSNFKPLEILTNQQWQEY